MKENGNLYSLAVLSPRESLRYVLTRRLGGPQSRSERPLISQCSHYADNAVPVPNDVWYKDNSSGLCRVIRCGRVLVTALF